MPNYTVGLDLGKERDPSALVVAERVLIFEGLPSEQTFSDPTPPVDTYHVRHVQRFELGTPYDTVVDSVGELLSTPELRDHGLLVFDRTGVGGPIADMFAQAWQGGRLGRCFHPLGITLTAGFSKRGAAHGYYDATAHKGDVVQRVYMLLERGHIKIPLGLPVAEQLQKELRAFRPKQNRSTGNLSFEAARESDHDDLVIALALAVWFPHIWGKPRYIDRHTGELQEQA